MGVYSIRDVESISGIKAHTLRIWEQRYDILKPQRTDSNIRYYDELDLKLILNISLLNKHGFKISRIAQMSEEELKSEVIQLTEKTNENTDRIQALTLCMLDLDEEKFEKIIATTILQIGFETAMRRVILPFLAKVGILWQAGSVSPAQEHFISNLIRQKIIVALDGQPSPASNPSAQKYLLYLPEGEWHELSLLFANYIIRSRRQKTVYLGQTLPVKDLQEAYRIYEPDFLLTVMTTSPVIDGIQVYLDNLSKLFPKTTILVTGSQVIGQGMDIPENMVLLNKIEDLIDFVDEKAYNQ